MAHVVHKLAGADGSLLWSSVSPPLPKYSNFYGNDHLIVSSDAVFVIAGSTYTLADCAWVERLDAATGQRLWWLNGTATVANAVLSSDSSALYLAFANGSLATVDAATGAVDGTWDLSDIVPAQPGAPSVGWYMSLAPAAAADGADVLLFSGNYSFAGVRPGSASSGTNATVLWRISDPLQCEFAPTLRAVPVPPPSTYGGTVIAAAGGNYEQGAGVSAIDAATGTIRWSVPSSNVISTVAALAGQDGQGWFWQVSMLGSGSYAVVSVSSLATGKQLASPAYYDSLGFTSAPVLSADGACLYMYGSGTIEVQSSVTLLSWCFNGSAITPEMDVQLSGINAPSGSYSLAPGPAEGQLTLWHSTGAMVVQAYTPGPPPPPPSSDPVRAASGEVAALVLTVEGGGGAASCPVGPSDMTLVPAAAVRPAAGSAAGDSNAPEWVLGPSITPAGLASSTSCTATQGSGPVDTDGRRAWMSFACLMPGARGNTVYTGFLAELALGKPTPGGSTSAPQVTGLCVFSRSGGLPSFFFDASVTAEGPYFVDFAAEFGRPMYGVQVPPLPLDASGAPATGLLGGDLPSCTQTQLANLRGSPLLPYAAKLVSGGSGSGILYGASASDLGVRFFSLNLRNSGVSTVDARLPCDTGVCVGSTLSFLGIASVSSSSSGGADGLFILAAGSAPYYSDWTAQATLGLAAIAAGSANSSSLTMPTSWTGLVNAPGPGFPMPSTGAAALLPDPEADSGAGPLWAQSLSWGSWACTNISTPASLQSVAISLPAGGSQPSSNSAAVVLDVSMPACPLPAGSACYGVALTHVSAFASG